MQDRKAAWRTVAPAHEPTTIEPSAERIARDIDATPTWRDFRLICAAILLRASGPEDQPNRHTFVVSDLWRALWHSETDGLLADSHHQAAHLIHLASAAGGCALAAIGEDQRGQTVWSIRDLTPIRRGAGAHSAREARTVLREAWADLEGYRAELKSATWRDRMTSLGIVPRETEPAPFMADLFE